VACPWFSASCADEGGPVATDTAYLLSCPSETSVPCGAIDQGTCLRPEGGPAGARELFGLNGETSCERDDPVLAICEAQETEAGDLLITLEAAVGSQFAFELRGAVVDRDGTNVEGTCQITIVEDSASYGGSLGACGSEPPSLEQPCQISNVVVDDAAGIDLSFDFECEGLISPTSTQGFDVDGSARFARCQGL